MSSYMDLVRKVNEKKKANSSTGNITALPAQNGQSSTYLDLVKKVNSGTMKFGTKMDRSQVEKWYQDVNAVSKRGYNFITREEYRAADEVLTSDIGKYLDQADDVAHYIRVNKDSFQDYDKTLSDHYDTVRYLRQIEKGVKGTNDFLSSFTPDEEQAALGYTAEGIYQGWLQDDTFRKKYAGKTYDEILATMGQLADGAEKDWLTANAQSYMTDADYGSELGRIEEQLAMLEAERAEAYKAGDDYFSREEISRYNEIITKIKSLWQRREELEEDRKYALLPETEDFSQYSGYMSVDDRIAGVEGQIRSLEDERANAYKAGEDYFTSEEISRNNELAGKISELTAEKDSLKSDPVYEIVNGKDAWSDVSQLQAWGKISDDLLSDLRNAQYMRGDEVSTYNYLYSTQGSEAANTYLRYLNTKELGSRHLAKVWQEATLKAQRNPVVADIQSIGLKAISGAGYLDAMTQKIKNDLSGDYYAAINYSTGNMAPSVAGSAIRGERSKAWAKSSKASLDQWGIQNEDGVIALDPEANPILSKIFNGRSLGDVYQLGMSAADSASIALLSSAMGPGSTLLLAGSAATQAMLEAVENGATDEQALLMGTLSGAFEYLFEKYELESLLKNGSESVRRAFAVQALSEAFGEGATTTANLVADYLVMADKSEVNRSIEAYMEENPGMTKEEAARKAMLDMAVQIGWDSAGGAVSGGFMGGGYSAINSAIGKISNAVYTQGQYAMTGESFLRNGGDVKRLSAFAQELVDASDAKLAGMVRRVNKQATNKNVGRLLHDVINTMNRQDSKDLAARLQEKGIASDRAAAIAEAVIAVRRDSSSMTQEQESLLREVGKDPLVVETVGEVLDTEGSSAYQRNAQLRAVFVEPTVPETETANGGAEGVAETLTELARQKVEADYGQEDVTAEELGIESAEGKILLEDKAVEIADVDTAGNGKVTVKLADGRSVDASALEFPDTGEAELWRVVGKYAEDAASARALLEEYRAGNLDAYKYARGVEEGFLFGKLNMSPKQMEMEGSYVNLLNPMQRNMAYQQGVIAGKRQARQRQEKLQAAKRDGNNKKGKLHFEGDRGKLTERQKVSLQACEVIAKALGIQVYVFESKRSASGKRIGDNGWYDPKDGSIHIDLYAGQNGEGVMVFTLAHELTHFIKDWSPKKFRTLAGFLAEQYAKKGENVDLLVRRQQQKAEADGRKLSYEQAHEEWVADSLETMLTDGAILEKLSMLQAKDASLMEKIKEFLNKFLQRLKAAYQGVSPQTQEGRIVSDMVDAAQELRDLFADALIDAGENFRSAEKNTTGEGGVRYSIRRDIVDINGKEYDSVVELDKSVSARTLSDPKRLMKYIEHNLVGVQIPVIDASGSTEIIEFARPKEVTYKNGKRHPVLGELKYTKGDTRKQVIINAVEVIGESVYDPQYSSTDNEHGWLDKNGWQSRKTFVLAKDGNIYEAYLKIAKAKDGRNILYAVNLDINKGIAVDQGATQKRAAVKSAMPSDKKIPQREADVKENDSTGKRVSSRDLDGASSRELLLQVFEKTAANSKEYEMLQQYKEKVTGLNKTEDYVDGLTNTIGRMRKELQKLMSSDIQNTDAIAELKGKIETYVQSRREALQLLNKYDQQLIYMENNPLRGIIRNLREASWKKGYDKAREYYRESRRQAVERHDQTQMRQKIKRVVRDLWKLQERAPKHRRTKEELRGFVDSAIKAADLIWLERYDEYDMIRNGIDDKYPPGDEKRLLEECRELLEKHLEISDADVDTRWDIDSALQQAKDKAALDKELAKRMKILRDNGVFAEEFKRLHQIDAGQILKDLMDSYKKLQHTDSPYLANAYQEKIQIRLQEIIDDVGVKPIRNMTLQELEKLYEAYSGVLHVVRNANKLFADERAGEITTLGTRIVNEMDGFARKVMGRKFMETLRQTAWNNLTPAYVFRRIGSATLERLYKNMVKGMGTYGKDIAEAKVHWQQQAKKYGAFDWDMDKRTEFVDKTGKSFSLSLGQLMSLYALSRRQQALGHLEIGGIRLDAEENYVENVVDRVLPKVMRDASVFKLDKAALSAICSKLTPEQKSFVEATQGYLSTVMAEKGNAVSMKLYGIRLFREKIYFPLRTANDTRYQSTELIDQNKLKNSGFTKETDPNANNAVELSDYSNVWTSHVKQMSLYHGMTLPMEDMDRILNFGRTFAKDENGNIQRDKDGNPIEEFEGDSISATLRNIWGEHPENYLRDLMKQLNGGVRSDTAEDLPGKMLSRFKKSAVAGSLSVWIQQWTSVFRSMAYIPMKHFFQKPMGRQREAIVAEMKKHCPIAIIKEMGGFDTGMGSSEHDFITMRDPQNAEELWKEIKKHPIKRFDELTGWLPGRADETTWAHIWTAVKRETLENHPELKRGSDEFYKAASDRFTEVINLTQVYDSVLSKSALMRSKGFGAKMITQFASEPTVALNMAVDAMLQQHRTGKLQVGTAFALVGSVVANAMSSALIYAMRDDDEEETFWEKYSASVLGNLIDGLNPLTYMPIIRDIWSAAQGYDVKRSDMEIWGQVLSSMEELVRKYNDEDTADKERAEAWASVADWILALFGVPAKNIRREMKGFGNLWRTLEADYDRETTARSMGDVIQDTWWSSIPLMRLIKGETKAKKLMDAYMTGDTKYADRLRGTYKTEDSANNAVVKEVQSRFEDGKLTDNQVIEYLTKYAGKTDEKAQDYLTKWRFAMENPDTVLEDSQILKYEAFAEPAGISQEVYARYAEEIKGLESDKDEDGEPIDGSVREKVWAVINGLPLSKKQKDALHYASGYKESSLNDAPWN